MFAKQTVFQVFCFLLLGPLPHHLVAPIGLPRNHWSDKIQSSEYDVVIGINFVVLN